MSKDTVMSTLEQLDSSDLLGQTKAYCQAVIPDLKNKQEVWNKLFSDEKSEMGLYMTQELIMGFRPQTQQELMKNFEEPFFEQISGLVERKAKSLSEYYYKCLQPNLAASQAEIDRFEIFLAKI